MFENQLFILLTNEQKFLVYKNTNTHIINKNPESIKKYFKKWENSLNLATENDDVMM